MAARLSNQIKDDYTIRIVIATLIRECQAESQKDNMGGIFAAQLEKNFPHGIAKFLPWGKNSFLGKAPNKQVTYLFQYVRHD